MYSSIIAITILALASQATLFTFCKLRPSSNPIFYVLTIEAWIYLHLAPALSASDIGPSLYFSYVISQVAALLLFEIPLSVCYIFFIKRQLHNRKPVEFSIAANRIAIFIVAMLASGLIFYDVVSKGDLWFKSLGHEGLAERYRELPLWSWLVYRVWEKTGVAFVALSAGCALLCRGRIKRTSLLIMTVLSCGGYVKYVLSNSRLEALLLITVVAIAILKIFDANLAIRHARRLTAAAACNRPKIKFRQKTRSRWAIVAFLGLFLSMYSLKIVYTSRIEFIDAGGFQTKWLNPFYKLQDTELHTPWWWRLNGIDLIAQARQTVIVDGVDWLGGWKYIVDINISPSRLKEAKEDLRTTAKSYMIAKYLGNGSPDYFSCALTDVYGNLGFAGFPACAMVFGFLCAIIEANIGRPRNGTGFLIALIAAISLLRFEHDFAATISDLIKTIVVTIPILLINPLKARRALLLDGHARGAPQEQ